MCGLESHRNFHCFAEHTVLFVGGLKGAALFCVRIEKMRFSPRVGIGTCHSVVRMWRKVASLVKRATYH